MTIKPKEATSIINSLLGGVAPSIGVQHITVGRKAEVDALVKALDEVKIGHSLVKFWIGDFGSGKSFMLHLINTVAIRQKFVVANADFTPDNRLYATDGKAVALYTALIDNLMTATRPEGGALPSLLEKWIEKTASEAAADAGVPADQMLIPANEPKVRQAIGKSMSEITEVGAFDFTNIVLKYYEGYVRQDEQQMKNALRWLKGEYRTKTEARQDLGVREIIDDQNYYDMLKNLCKLVVSMGYSGLMINLDEAINLYKIGTSAMREKNYEKILTIYNDCLQGKVQHLFFNFAGTTEVLENERRGLFSYAALKSRLETNQYETAQFRDFAQPVIRLLPLDNNEIFLLLTKLKVIFDQHYQSGVDFNEDDIRAFMEDLFNKPGASDFLTPREVIRDFLNILNLLRQNPQADKRTLVGNIEIRDERPGNNDLNAIEEL
jgi:hypothetical protein